ncbi:hypothetical protein EV44_g5468 [Erysiphe necator]|uniref:Uncharacterized protein n=1 Tax=Uncinula necator TaxID=52586 RepID=A0A0B1NZ93_UNCNE|nr:hypothetical protein EV44_g5468 [Erysiphe necator]
MSAIYTARSIGTNEKSTPLFTLKGLVNYAPSTITNLTVYGVPLERQVAYAQYASNIASFIAATDRRQVVTISPKPLGLLTKSLHLPMTPPAVNFTLIKPLPSDRSDKFISRLGPGAGKTQSGKTTIYQAPAIPDDILPTINLLSTPFFNAGRDAVNPKVMLPYKRSKYNYKKVRGLSE